jgi:hypothetical protein
LVSPHIVSSDLVPFSRALYARSDLYFLYDCHLHVYGDFVYDERGSADAQITTSADVALLVTAGVSGLVALGVMGVRCAAVKNVLGTALVR